MRRRGDWVGLAAAAMITAAPVAAKGDLQKRVEVVQEGDFVLIGNTLAQDCNAANTPAPTVGTLNCMDAGNMSDLPPDVFWQASANGAIANSTITDAQASSTAVLSLPEGATVTLYSTVADITDYVKENGAGAYRVSGIETTALNGVAPEQYPYAVWWIVVLYKNSADPHRQLVIYDGFDQIDNGGDSNVQITGLLVPKNFASSSGAKVGVVGYDGDNTLIGDQFFLGDTALADASGEKDNFFNSTRSYLGSFVSVPGDLPQLKGTVGSMNRLDIDVIDVTALLKEGQTKVDFKAVSAGESVGLAGIVTSIPTFTDADGDGLSDHEEELFGKDENDQDSDNDGLPDGQEGCSNLLSCPSPNWNLDSDGDGVINALDPDADNDGLFDSTELGLDCYNPDTDKTLGHCINDFDPKTTTDPLDADTDDGGIIDGSEDTNLDGNLDTGETDPTSGKGDDDGTVMDSDGDGLSDGLEYTIGSNKNDTDSDNDGVSDGEEANPADDIDGDGLPSVLDTDADNDGLFDGTETGKDCSNPDTDVALGHCVADADPSTTTSPIDADTDDGGVSDGSEDSNLDGKLDAGETDPTAGHPTDDGTVTDQDGDGLSDNLEINLGSNPTDKDSDDDGVPDGQEANPSNDEDGDGKINILDEDSDGDGLYDGTEGGYGCSDPSTDKPANHCIPDGDKGKTKTSMVNADTDFGGLTDGDEDFDKDGIYDATQGENNPNDPNDDIVIAICTDGISDHPTCGPEDSGTVCSVEHNACIAGCRGLAGSGCPEGQVCSSSTEEIGFCSDAEEASGEVPEGSISSDGCNCGLLSGRGDRDSSWMLIASMAAIAAPVRRRLRLRRASRS